MEQAPYTGVRVLEISAGIPASYCGKLFADAGADVVKLEPASGDPTRRWSASGTHLLKGEDSALFAFLNTGKRSVIGTLDETPRLESPELVPPRLLAGTDVLVLDQNAGLSPAAIRSLSERHPGIVVVSLAPFGLTGPYVEAGRPATEFTLQALCGSAAGRGLPDGTPTQAGGRIGEWIAASYAAAAAAAALRGRKADGQGTLIDLSILESMVVSMGGAHAIMADLGGPILGRSIELPSIEPTSDGLVGLCTITGQQFQDLLVLMDRADLLDDAELTTPRGRMMRREEFGRAVREWTTAHTTDEILELAAAMRIPAAPIGSPETVTAIDHFAERGVFVENPAGFVQPRVPYRIGDFRGVPLTAAPRLGADTVTWSARPVPPRPVPPRPVPPRPVPPRPVPPRPVPPRPVPARPVPRPGPRDLPLRGIRVLDLTAFWAGPLATHLLSALGADVIKVEGLSRPDGMRFSGTRPPSTDGWWETGNVFVVGNGTKRGLTLELGKQKARELALRLAAECDVVMENFSPRVLGNLGLDPETLRSANPRAVIVRMPAFGLDGPWRDRVGFAQTMEQAGGMAWLTGPAGGAPMVPRGACDPIAGLHAAFATLAALEHRDRTGRGELVEATMVEAALNVEAEAIVERSAYGTTLMRDGNRGPGAVPQGIYRCAGDDAWIALAVTDAAQWSALTSLIPGLTGITPERSDPQRSEHDRIDTEIDAWCAIRTPSEAVTALTGEGIAAAEVIGGARLFDDPQLAARGFFERVENPVAGEHRVFGLPFRLGDHRTWNTRPAPTLGQHNREILTGLLGLTDTEVKELEESDVIGTRPSGL
ncbi:CaiB/BaiF CoA transferase family protein [Actinomadura sp. 9N407]|uniref:CaiB/BaiF CoA transferase family protein n=1 Tax=Actinomadura sp. 9N407 TaxID=3375154 RepID=UPI00379CAC44